MAAGPGDGGALLRPARTPDLDAVARLTRDAYAPYTALLGAPPLPVTEDYAARIAAGEVWLLETSSGALAGLLVLERHADKAVEEEVHLLIGHESVRDVPNPGKNLLSAMFRVPGPS